VFGPGDFMASLGMGGLNVGAQVPSRPATRPMPSTTS